MKKQYGYCKLTYYEFYDMLIIMRVPQTNNQILLDALPFPFLSAVRKTAGNSGRAAEALLFLSFAAASAAQGLCGSRSPDR